MNKIIVILSCSRSHGTSLMTKLLYYARLKLTPFIRRTKFKNRSMLNSYEIFELTPLYKNTMDFVEDKQLKGNQPLLERNDKAATENEFISSLTKSLKNSIENHGSTNFGYKNLETGRLLLLHKEAYKRANVEPIFIYLHRNKDDIFKSIKKNYYQNLTRKEFDKFYSQTENLIDEQTKDNRVIDINYNDIVNNAQTTLNQLIPEINEEGFNLKHYNFANKVSKSQFTKPGKDKLRIDDMEREKKAMASNENDENVTLADEY